MKRILKRFFVFIISFVLVFSISVPCFASDTSSGATGWNSWTLKEKTDYCCKVGVDIIASVTGIVHGDTSSYKEFLLDLYASNPKAGVDNFYEYLATGLTFDDDTQTWELSDDLVQFCNTVITDYNDRVTMVYRYPITPSQIDGTTFRSPAQMQALVDFLQEYPDYYLVNISGGSSDSVPLETFTIYGTDTQVQADGARFWLSEAPFAGVGNYPDLMSSSVTLYNQEWSVTKCSQISIAIYDGVPYYVTLSNKYDGGARVGYTLEQFKDASISWFDSNITNYMSLDFSWRRSLEKNCFYSGNLNALNVYKTVADMKKDIGSQFIGSYADTYTGTPSQTITQSEVNNFVNNYYPDSGSGGGSGSGSGSDSGGGSSGGIFDDIISGIASGVGSIIKGIFSIVKQLVDAVADAIASITKSITDLSSLLKTGFTDFLSAVFPFLPQEFITILIAGLSLFLLGVTIKILRG